MSKFEGLYEHSQWRDFLLWLKKEVDNAKDRVIVESSRAGVEEIRYAAGKYAALQDLFNALATANPSAARPGVKGMEER